MTIEALLTDESFISYCKKDNPEDIHRWETYIKENPAQYMLVETARERYIELFKALAIADQKEQEALLIARINQAETPPVVQMNEPPNKGRFVPWLLRISAAAMIVLIVGYFMQKSPVEQKIEPSKSFAANYGERKNFQLPDGSIVILNAGSSIRIDGNYGTASRDIFLEGEAFFDVKHNQGLPFIVHTPAMDVKALGTAFNVKAYPGEKGTETSLLRGSVEVTLKKDNDRKLILKPNQKVQWGQQNPETTASPSDAGNKKTGIKNGDALVTVLEKTDMGDVQETGWIENKLIFNDDALQDIAILLERWYGIKVVFEDDATKNYRFTGTFEKESLKMVLDVLKESRNFHYEIQPGNTMIVSIEK
jgi:ferric-dicitrate binding protein FerR (iron transport regulator)